MSASEPLPPFEPEDKPAPAPPSPGERPDWLIGADEGADAEHARRDRATPEVKLIRPAALPVEGLERGGDALRSEAASVGLPLPPRPMGDATATPTPTPTALPGLPLSSRTAPAAAEARSAAPARPVAWTAKSSSVPKLSVAPAAPRPSAGASPMPGESEPAPDPMIEAGGSALIGGNEAAAMRTQVTPLDEPWWMVIGERLMTDRVWQIGIASVVALIVAAMVFWPREGHGVSIGRIKRHPEAYEGQLVRVNGRVEEVFPLGQGWVYDLRQGHDTITVFTRGDMPRRHQGMQVIGQVSMGYLDGRPRVAILEGDQP